MIRLSHYDFFVFDCDGVILDSNEIKTNSFAQALSNEDEHLVMDFIRYHLEHGGISRYVKFKHFYDNIKKQPSNKCFVEESLLKYSKICKESLVHCDEIEGASILLRQLKNNGKRCYISSGGEQEELRFIMKKRLLSRYFDEIYGSPMTKNEHLDIILRSTSGLRGLFLGDSRVDYEASLYGGLDFLYLYGKSEWDEGRHFCSKNKIFQIENFSKLDLIKEADLK